MEFSAQQKEAAKRVRAWLKAGNEQVFYLAGFAGTGKSTIAREIAEADGHEPVYGAFTGKAAVVMRKSGCRGAATIHSLIYKAVQDEVTGECEFLFNHDSICADADMIVIDECSMVGEDIGKDLLRYGKPVLVLGDPAQLPPVSSGGFFTAREPNYMMTEIHRQAEGNPIIHLASIVRSGGRLEPGSYGESLVVEGSRMNTERVMGCDQVLVGKNATRQKYNGRLRELKGFEGDIPRPGETLVCLRNDREKGIFNGGIYRVLKAQPKGRHFKMAVKSEDFEEAPPVEVVVRREFFTEPEKKIDWKELRGTQEFTYGYALTVHKSQGSQWPSVAIFDESYIARADADRWLYTGITRASDRVLIGQ